MVTETLIITEAVKASIAGIVGKYIVPKVTGMASKMGLKYDKMLVPKGEHFEEYLNRTYKRLSILNTLALKNSQRQLKDIYVPLTLVVDRSDDKKKEEYKVEGFPEPLIKKYNHILITDTAGMGKSTMIKRMFLDVVDNGYGIPIFIDLRRLSGDHPILKEIQEQLSSLTKEFDSLLLMHLLQSGGFIFFLDGYDEIKISQKEKVTCDIHDFISKAEDNYFILTSRPESALAGFGSFQQISIKPLAKKEAFDLLRKYDSNGTTSKSLIDKLKSGCYSVIDDFLKNPLLVSLLFTAYDYKQTIPLKKHIFYRQVYDAYFDSHDLSKGDGFIHDKKSLLSIDDFNKILRHVAYSCLRRQSIEFCKDEIIGIIDEAKGRYSYLDFKSSDLLDDLLKAVPLFCQDGVYYKWTHKSLQEYFAARYIYEDAKGNQDRILQALYDSDKFESYYNLLDIYFDIDTEGFNKNLTKNYLSDFISFYTLQNHTIKDISEDSIKIRASLLYGHQFIMVRHKEEKAFGNLNELFKMAGINSFHYGCCFWYDASGNLYCLNSISRLNKMDKLLYSKYPELYYEVHKPKIEKKLYCMKPESVVQMTMDAFSLNQEFYDYTNQCMMAVRDTPFLRYDAVSAFLNNLDAIIKKSENSDDITGGL